MTDTQVYAGAAVLGMIAGMRSMSAPAIVSGMARAGVLPLRNQQLKVLAHPATVATTATLAAGEIVADKLPFIPARIEIGPLVTRAISGALCGAAISSAKERQALIGALVGACAAIGASFTSYHLRHYIVKSIRIPDLPVALTEDAVVAGSGWLLYCSMLADSEGAKDL